mgnify:CR=1 FL=1
MIRWLLRLLLGCSHDWKLVVEREMPSIAEGLIKANVSVAGVLNSAMFDIPGEAGRIAAKKIVAVLTCHKCGGIATREFANR